MKNGAALVELLQTLRRHDYRFTTVTPTTHATVLARKIDRRPGLRDILGWNRSFDRDDLEPRLYSLLQDSDAIDVDESGKLKSRIRVASLDTDLFAHSAFPTDDVDAVFFGPDTYRFVRFIKHEMQALRNVRHVVDMGAGTGAGGLTAARGLGHATITLVDVNPVALQYASANAAAAEIDVELEQSDRIPARADLLIANPPYLMDVAGRAYRDGGELLGAALALDWVRQGLERMPAGATILLYTGAAYNDEHSPLLVALKEKCRTAGAQLSIDEIDPDVFGDELRESPYRDVERIAAVGIKVRL